VRAFPSAAIDPNFGGMDLRDWFAGQALASMLSNPQNIDKTTPPLAAKLSYDFADAMMAERERNV
jgi:hypothetical protein